MMKTTGLLAIVAALALAACGSSNKSSSSNSSTGSTTSASSSKGYGAPAASTKTTSGSTVSNGGLIAMKDYMFQPKTITGKPGQTVKLKLKNEGSTQHNFKIDSQLKQADADVKPGASATVSVTIPKSGTLQFYCEYHKKLGMTGTVKAS